jgi:tetratricopeptide (TPR) repeat protein
MRGIAGDDVPTFLIVGPEGIGKTRLVKGMLEQVSEHQHPDVITVYRQTHGPQSFTANDLADLLKDAVGQAELETNATRLERLDAVIGRKLEVLIDLFRDKRMVVALDSCEALLDEETGKFVSAELDDALEVLASRRRSVVKLLLVTREQPLVRNRRWLSKAFTLSLDKGLSLDDFKKILADLDPDDDHGLRHPPDDVVSALHERTGGRPRAAEVVHAILTRSSITESEHSPLATLADVVAALAGFGPDDALGYLTGRLMDGLALEERRVLQAVSAFGVPVGADAVEFMLPGEGLAEIDRRLRNLRVSHLVRRTHDGRYYVQPPDDSRAFEAVHLPVDDGVSDRRAHIRRAATYFALRRQPEVKGLSDLAAEFAEIDLLLQAEDFDAALRAIERVDDYLVNWGCRWVLRRQRERLRGLLRNDLDELVNLHALGDIAMKRDDLAAAESYFRQAVSYLDGYSDPDIETKLLVSLGAVLQRRDEMVKADRLYRAALEIAKTDARGDKIASLMGLAETCRYWGQFTTAVKHLRQALRLARVANGSMPDNQRQLSEILLKLGWRYMDLNDFDHASALIDEAGTLATEVDSWDLRCRHLDAAAHLQLRQQQIDLARENSQAALHLALELGRTPLQRQIYTTLAMCSLLDGDMEEAAANIAAADRGRLAGHVLTTLALRGLIEYRRGNLAPAQSMFRQLRLEAAERGRRDRRDFGALDMEGFARCGEHLRRVSPPSLRPAIDIFHEARRLTRAPGMTAQLVQLLELFGDERLAPGIAAAAGDDIPE